MVEPRLAPGLAQGFGVGRPKIYAGSAGSVSVGGKIGMGRIRLYGSPTVIVWSIAVYTGRAKIAKGSGILSRKIHRGLL